jgi:thioredoxin-like negative regulator of GroEL
MIAVENKESFDAAVENTPLLVAEFYAGWCENCPPMLELLQRMADEYKDIPFLTVDIDALPEVKESARIKAIPMVVFYRGGKIRDFLYGVANEDKFRRKMAMQLDVLAKQAPKAPPISTDWMSSAGNK